MSEAELIAEFSRLWYSKGAIKLGSPIPVDGPMRATYCGFLVQKNPLDLWIYQELIWECKPDLIIEMGTASGGTTLFMANVLDLLDIGEIISVDQDNRLGIVPKHPRITYWVGDVLADAIYQALLYYSVQRKKVMVILDDDHSTDHVIKELLGYAPMVSIGQYLIVEDTNVDYPLNGGPGPGAAVDAFMASEKDIQFVVDHSREKFLMTWNPGGYLKRVK